MDYYRNTSNVIQIKVVAKDAELRMGTVWFFESGSPKLNNTTITPSSSPQV